MTQPSENNWKALTMSSEVNWRKQQPIKQARGVRRCTLTLKWKNHGVKVTGRMQALCKGATSYIGNNRGWPMSMSMSLICQYKCGVQQHLETISVRLLGGSLTWTLHSMPKTNEDAEIFRCAAFKESMPGLGCPRRTVGERLAKTSARSRVPGGRRGRGRPRPQPDRNAAPSHAPAGVPLRQLLLLP